MPPDAPDPRSDTAAGRSGVRHAWLRLLRDALGEENTWEVDSGLVVFLDSEEVADALVRLLLPPTAGDPDPVAPPEAQQGYPQI